MILLPLPLSFLFHLREVSQIPAYQPPILHLIHHGSRHTHENHQPQRTCELGLFLFCLSYFVGPRRGCLRVTICAYPPPTPSCVGARAPKKRSCMAQLHPGPSQDDGQVRGLILSAWEVPWTHPSPAFAAVLRKKGSKLPALYLAHGLALKPNAPSACEQQVVIRGKGGGKEQDADKCNWK